MKLRTLKAEEIRVRAQVNNGGVKLFLWKYPDANLAVLDDCEEIGITNRKVSYSDNGKRCTLSIRLNGEWISNDGYAFEGSPDNEPNDALNHAGFAWGIGKELYKAPEMFIYKDDLKAYKESPVDEKGEPVAPPVCYDEFRVANISYENGGISSITIEICTYGKPYSRKVFKAQQTTPAPTDVLISDEEIILIGNCKGKTYGEVKETPVFKSFLGWTKTSNKVFTDPAQADQFRRFKLLAA